MYIYDVHGLSAGAWFLHCLLRILPATTYTATTVCCLGLGLIPLVKYAGGGDASYRGILWGWVAILSLCVTYPVSLLQQKRNIQLQQPPGSQGGTGIDINK
jgi:hypothetical protein